MGGSEEGGRVWELGSGKVVDPARTRGRARSTLYIYMNSFG